MFVLIDARHGIKPADVAIMTLLDEAAVNYQAVLTKADKPEASELEAMIAKVKAELAKRPAAYPEVIVTSARMGEGVKDFALPWLSWQTRLCLEPMRRYKHYGEQDQT